jgi:hypothetical protein
MSSIYRFLTDDGLVGDGTNQEITGAADVHWIKPPDGEIWRIERLLIQLEDAGSVTWSTFGALSALTNGCKLEKLRGSAGGSGGAVVTDLLDGTTIKTNGDFARYCYDVTSAAPGSGNDKITVRWTLSKSGQPLKLVGGLNEELRFTTQDDTTGLVGFTIMAQGWKETG